MTESRTSETTVNQGNPRPAVYISDRSGWNSEEIDAFIHDPEFGLPPVINIRDSSSESELGRLDNSSVGSNEMDEDDDEEEEISDEDIPSEDDELEEPNPVPPMNIVLERDAGQIDDKEMIGPQEEQSDVGYSYVEGATDPVPRKADEVDVPGPSQVPKPIDVPGPSHTTNVPKPSHVADIPDLQIF